LTIKSKNEHAKHIKPNKANGKIGTTPIAAKIIHTFLWTISIFNENKSSNNKTAEANVIKGNNKYTMSADQKL
jgi:hypothetical protein